MVARRSLLLLLAVLAVTALLRFRLLGVPLERDEGEYAYMGQLILAGETPYLAAHNMKLPGVYYSYAAILALLGESIAAIRTGLLAVNLLAIALVFSLARRLLDERAAVVAAAVYAALSLSESVLGFTANAEHFVLPPVLAGVVLLLRALESGRRTTLIAAGVCLGVAFVMKQHAAAFVLFGFVWLGIGGGRRPLARVVADQAVFAAGAVLPYAVVCALMARAGALSPFWFWTFIYAREYVSFISLAEGLGGLRSEGGRIAAIAGPLWALAAAGLAALYWTENGARTRRFLFAFTAFSFLAVAPGLRFTEHYFVLALPATSLLAASAAGAAARLADGGGPRLGALVRVGLPLLALGLWAHGERDYLFRRAPHEVARFAYGLNPFPEAVEIGAELRRRSAPADRIGVIGSEPQIYFYAGRRAATSYMYTYPLMEPHPFAERMQREMIAQLEAAAPRFLVLVNVDSSWSRRSGSSTALFDWAEERVNEGYRLIGIADIVSREQTVYLWDEEARAARPRSQSHVLVFEKDRRPRSAGS